MPSNKTEKKRKRDSGRHERPSKKPARDLQTLPPLAASVIDDSSELAPVISEFSAFPQGVVLLTLHISVNSRPSKLKDAPLHPVQQNARAGLEICNIRPKPGHRVLRIAFAVV